MRASAWAVIGAAALGACAPRGEQPRRTLEQGRLYTSWLSGTQWRGRAAMRISVSNWQTSVEDVDRSVAAILDAAAAVTSSPR